MYDVELVTSKGAIDCGAACMAMLLSYYSTDIPLDDLIEEDLHSMLRFANTAAYIVTTKKGAIKSMPDRAQVEQLL